MPQIIVVADTPGESGAEQVMFREHVTKRDFESGHFAMQLAERLGWAVGDAHAVEHSAQARRIETAASALQGGASGTTAAPEGGASGTTAVPEDGTSGTTAAPEDGTSGTTARDDGVSAEMPQRRSARVVTTAS